MAIEPSLITKKEAEQIVVKQCICCLKNSISMLVTLAYGFLLGALAPSLCLARSRLLVHWDQRADWRQWNVKLPLYRLWLSHPPGFAASGPIVLALTSPGRLAPYAGG